MTLKKTERKKRETRMPAEKISPHIMARLSKLTNAELGQIADRLEISFQAVKVNFTNNAPCLQKNKWQSEIRKILSLPPSVNINVPRV